MALIRFTLGELKSASELGRKGTKKYIWSVCPSCNGERWVVINKGKPVSLRCCHCQPKGENSYSWRGRRLKASKGYLLIRLSHDNPYFSMADKRSHILEHRFIMAQHLERCLGKREIVHHKNGVRDDNRLENLELSTRANHALSYSEGYTRGLKHGLTLRDKALEKQVKLLQWQIKELQESLRLKLAL